MIVSFPTSRDISIEINGKRLAVAQSYKVKASKESRYIESFGQEEPVGTVGGRNRYLIELSLSLIHISVSSPPRGGPIP